jgi:RIO kinase 1
MARKWSKRKRPDRNVHPNKEHEKTDEGIFNRRIMIYLSKFYNKGIVDRVDFVIARGKEAEVYVADPGTAEEVEGQRFVALKFFRVETSSFYKMMDYIEGDPRFGRIGKGKSAIVNVWCRKEFGNLKLAYEAGISVPKPYMCNGSILAMQFIGSEEGVPSPRLKEVPLDDPGNMLDQIIKEMGLLYRAGLVHADLSEYNILVNCGKPIMIDMGQAVVLRHPNAGSFILRDVHNICQYFRSRYKIKRDEKTVLDAIRAP